MSTKAFPDLGDRVVTRWTAEGTHLGDFIGHDEARLKVGQQVPRTKALHLTVNRQNAKAVMFYRRNGFLSTKAFLMIRLLAPTNKK